MHPAGIPHRKLPLSERFRAELLSSGGRFGAIDVARGIAIVGMLAAHTVHAPGDMIYDGRSAVLFAVLAGLSIGFMTGGATPLPRGSRARPRVSLLIRAVALIILGLALWVLETPIAIILDSYGILFIMALAVLYLPVWALVTVALLSAVIGPVIVAGLSLATPFDPVNAFDPVSNWFVGYYPTPVWFSYLAAGLAIARCDLARTRTHLIVLGVGILSMAMSYGAAALVGYVPYAHADNTFDVFAAGGFAFTVIACLLLLFSMRGAAQTLAVLSWPLRAIGTMPLTIYTAQILALWALMQSDTVDTFNPDATPDWVFWALVLGSILFACVWRVTRGQGPLEYLMARLSLRAPWRTRAIETPAHPTT